MKNGVQDIKGHAWFSDINWIALLNKEVSAPFTPKISGAGDCSNFDDFKDEYKIKHVDKCLYEKEFSDF